MEHIKMFESFQTSSTQFLYVTNSNAKSLLSKHPMYKKVRIDESINISRTDKVVLFLEANNFYSPDFHLVTEGDVRSLGLTDDVLYVDVKGHKYGHKEVEGGLEIAEIARKFEKMLQFSTWRALKWLNKQTDIVSGSKRQEKLDAEKLEKLKEAVDMKNYMFFQNLMTVKESIEKMLALDPVKVDELLNDHAWATDHIATSKDDIEEVTGFLCNTVKNDIVVGVKEAVNPLIKQHEGKRIKLISMGKDPRTGKTDPNPVKPGTEGVVFKVDDMGTMHVKWDDGRTLGIVPEVDKFSVLPDKK